MKRYLSLAWLLAGIGCGGGATPRDAAVASDAATGPTSCIETLLCAAECAESDTACTDACLAQASEAATAQLVALVGCDQREGCNSEDACLEARCASEIADCTGPVVQIDGGVIPTDDAGAEDEFPTRIEGTSRDFTAAGYEIDSNATVVWIRDDAAGDAAGFPIGRLAFYRLASIEYRATAMGSSSGCTTTADFTHSFTDLPAFENNLVIERAVGADGLHSYDFSIGLTVNHPDGLVTVCPPPIGTSTGEFNAEHYVTTGTEDQRTDLQTFVGTAPLGPRTRSWNLHRVD